MAENVSGSVRGFAARMNRTASALGMNSTTFRNPNGLPDPGQKTTARDLAKLGLALQDRFPTYYKYFGTRTFTYRGARMRNHNHLLGSVKGVDGIKTGYIRASGFNIVTNVKRTTAISSPWSWAARQHRDAMRRCASLSPTTCPRPNAESVPPSP